MTTLVQADETWNTTPAFVGEGTWPVVAAASDLAGNVTRTSQTLTITGSLALSTFTPATGPTGTQVTITGAGFTSASTVKFNGVAATVPTRTLPSKLIAVVPAAATTGKVSVSDPTVGTATSASSYTVTRRGPGPPPISAARRDNSR